MAPCVDDVLNGCETQHISASQAATGSHADHHDCCSPFCACSCCSLAMEVALSFFVSTNAPPPQKVIFSFDPSFISSFSYSFWQPPKLS
jgi:hypothetical protein